MPRPGRSCSASASARTTSWPSPSCAPPGGSWYLDWLTDQVADKAWGLFQDIERQGGMLRAVESGWVGKQIDSAFAPRAKNLARRKEGITGVSEFPDVAERRVVRPAP